MIPATYAAAMASGREAVLRQQASEGRTNWTKADYEFLALTVGALLGVETDHDDCEIERRAFRERIGA
jgi:hypothetical protein